MFVIKSTISTHVIIVLTIRSKHKMSLRQRFNQCDQIGRFIELWATF